MIDRLGGVMIQRRSRCNLHLGDPELFSLRAFGIVVRIEV